MTTYKTLFDVGNYPKPWTWNADATVTFISGGSDTLTGTQCPTIPVIDRAANKFFNISYYDDSLNKIVVHENAYNTVPNERLLITVNNGISLFNIDPVPKKLPIRIVGSFNQFDTYYNQNIKSVPFIDALNHKNGEYNYLYRTWDRFSLSSIGRDSERYVTQKWPKASDFIATAFTQVIAVSGGKYSISSRPEAYGGDFVGLNRSLSMGTADMSGEAYVDTIMSGLNQEFIDISKFYKPTSVNIWPSPVRPNWSTLYGFKHKDYIVNTNNQLLYPNNNKRDEIYRYKLNPSVTGSSNIFSALDYYIEAINFSYLERPNTQSNNNAVACESGFTFNSLSISGSKLTLDGVTTTDRSDIEFFTDDIVNNTIVAQSNKNNQYYYKDLSRLPVAVHNDYQPAGMQRNVNGKFYNTIVGTHQEVIFISGGGCYKAFGINSGTVWNSFGGGSSYNVSDIAYYESQYCDPVANNFSLNDNLNIVIGAEKYTIDGFKSKYNWEAEPDVRIKLYSFTRGTNPSNPYSDIYGHLTEITTITPTMENVSWDYYYDPDYFETLNAWIFRADIATEYNAALATLNIQNNITDKLVVVTFGNWNLTANYQPIRHPLPYTAYLDDLQQMVQGYTLTNAKLTSLGCYDFHFTPSISDPIFGGNINNPSGLTINVTNNVQSTISRTDIYKDKYGYSFQNNGILIDMDTGELYVGYWVKPNINPGYGVLYNLASGYSTSRNLISTCYNRSRNTHLNLKFVQSLYVEMENKVSGELENLTRFTWTKEYVTTDGGTTWTTLPFFNRWE